MTVKIITVCGLQCILNNLSLKKSVLAYVLELHTKAIVRNTYRSLTEILK